MSMTNPRPTGSDASVTEAMVARAARHIGGGSTFDEEDRLEMARAILEEAFAALSLPDNGVTEETRKLRLALAWIDNLEPELVAAAEDKFGFNIRALSLPTPKGKHIEDVYPDEAVAWRVIGGGAAGNTAVTAEPDFAAAWRVTLNVEPLYPPSALSAARQQGVLEGAREERERCANKAREYAGHYPEGSDGRNTFVILADWIEQGAPAAIRGAS